MWMRLRFPELLVERNLTAYALAKQIKDARPEDDRVSLSAIYRLVRARGRARYFDSDLMRVLWQELNLTRLEDLIDPEDTPPARKPKAKRKPRPRPRNTPRQQDAA